MADQQKLMMKTVYWALMISRFIFAYLVYEILAPMSEIAQDQSLLAILAGFASLIAIVSHFLFVKSYNLNFLRNSFLAKLINPLGFKPLDSKDWSDQDLERWQLCHRFQIFTIITWALSNSIAVLGVVTTQVGGGIKSGLAFIAVSLILGLLQKPNFDCFETQARSHLG